MGINTNWSFLVLSWFRGTMCFIAIAHSSSGPSHPFRLDASKMFLPYLVSF